MSKYYTAKTSRGIYKKNDEKPFRLSRSKIDLFMNCPRCFYIDRRLGVSVPPPYPYNLNSAVDALLKKEFDLHRVFARPHPYMELYNVDAIPFNHEKMDEWRDALTRGIQYLHEPTNFNVTGGIDDVWVNSDGELIIVDYKSTAKEREVSLDADWQIGYKRQVEIYQWLFRQNGFIVSPTAYFVYCNGNLFAESFNNRIDFKVKLIPYNGNDTWIEPALFAIKDCLESEQVPDNGNDCDFCKYRNAIKNVCPEES